MKDNRMKALIVEDDPTYLSFWKRFLEKLRVEPTCKKLLSEVEKTLENENFDIIIADVVLPDGNGYEILNWLVKGRKQIPIIFTTAYGAKLSRFKFPIHQFHLLHKPFQDLGQLKRLVLNMIRGKNVFEDAEEDSFLDNEDIPEVTEWNF